MLNLKKQKQKKKNPKKKKNIKIKKPPNSVTTSSSIHTIPKAQL